MSDRRLARLLLRLYPRAWRARYGDEFLAYVDDAGLTTGGVADIVAAAGVERGRSILDAARAQVDPAPLPVQDPPVVVGADTLFGPRVVCGVLVALTVVAFNAAGVPYPHWGAWFNLLVTPSSQLDRSMFTASIVDRGVASFLWFAAALGLVLLAYGIATVMRAWGVPEPPDGLVLGTMAAVVVSGILRGLYRGVRAGLRPAEFEAMRTGEIRAWQVATFAMMILWAFVDPQGRSLWTFTMIQTMALTLPAAMARHGETRRRVFAPPPEGPTR